METKRDQNLAMLAATFVLFSTLIDPRITIVLSVMAFIALLVYQFKTSDKQKIDNQERL